MKFSCKKSAHRFCCSLFFTYFPPGWRLKKCPLYYLHPHFPASQIGISLPFGQLCKIATYQSLLTYLHKTSSLEKQSEVCIRRHTKEGTCHTDVIQGKVLAVYLSLNSLADGKNSLIRNPYWKHTQTHKNLLSFF